MLRLDIPTNTLCQCMFVGGVAALRLFVGHEITEEVGGACAVGLSMQA